MQIKMKDGSLIVHYGPVLITDDNITLYEDFKDVLNNAPLDSYPPSDVVCIVPYQNEPTSAFIGERPTKQEYDNAMGKKYSERLKNK